MENEDNETKEYFFFEERLKSFKKWCYKPNENCSAEKLAEAGFYLIDENSESTRCFLCLKELEGWESTDDPWEEHIKHSKNCRFVQYQCKENDLTVGQIFILYEDFLKQKLTTKYQQLLKKIDNCTSNMKPSV